MEFKRYPLAIQLVVPNNKEEMPAFKDTLKKLKDYGFYGLELNVIDLSEESRVELKNMLDEVGLKMTKYASGKLANVEGLSLTSSDEDIRLKSVERLKDMIEFASYFEAGIILGFIKGGPNQNRIETEKNMIDSLSRITSLAEEKNVPIIIESTNHYETSTAITLEAAVSIAEKLNSDIYKILPDTYHMHIEEINPCASLQKYVKYYDSIHISDSNRYFPGLGAIDFKQIYKALLDAGFNGYLGIEGNTAKSPIEDVKITVDLMNNIADSLEYVKNIKEYNC